jgi:hypothetical protein
MVSEFILSGSSLRTLVRLQDGPNHLVVNFRQFHRGVDLLRRAQSDTALYQVVSRTHGNLMKGPVQAKKSI